MFSACCTEAAKVSTRSRPAGFRRENGDNKATSWIYVYSVAHRPRPTQAMMSATTLL